MGRLDGKICLITGAAGGIGRALAGRLAAEGAKLALSDISIQHTEEIAGEISAAAGVETIALPCDVSSAAEVQAMTAKVASHFGRLDVCLNNAGIAVPYALDEITEAVFNQAMAINVFGVIAGTQAAAAVMRGQGSGRIINTCSVAGFRASPGHAVYAATKFAVRALTQAFALELAQTGITVNAICPGYIDTPIWDRVSDSYGERRANAPSHDELLTAVARNIPLGRAGTPEDLTGLVVYLASDESAYMTGQCVLIDGGLVPN